MNARKRLPNLRRSEIDYKLSIFYAQHPDSPAIPIALHELKRNVMMESCNNSKRFIDSLSEVINVMLPVDQSKLLDI